MAVIHQVELTGTETVQDKLQLQKKAPCVGVRVNEYYTDNGIYTSREFAAKLNEKGQGIKHSGVGGHHHNWVAEIAIKNMVHTAWTMMIYAALCWTEHNERDLWPLALTNDVHLHNELPSMD